MSFPAPLLQAVHCGYGGVGGRKNWHDHDDQAFGESEGALK